MAHCSRGSSAETLEFGPAAAAGGPAAPGAADPSAAGAAPDALAALPPRRVRFATLPPRFRWGLWRGSVGVRPARRRAPRFSAGAAHTLALAALGRIEAMRLGDDEDAVQLRGAVGLLVDMLRAECAAIERANLRNAGR